MNRTKSIGTILGAVAAVTIATSPAAALDDARQLLSAGTSQGEGSTQFSAPGMSNVYGADFPNTGQGENAASIRVPAGTCRNLRVNVQAASAPMSGSFRARLRVNGADTPLTCTTTGTGTCNSAQSVAVATNDKVTIKVSNTFVGSGNLAWTATLEFD